MRTLSLVAGLALASLGQAAVLPPDALVGGKTIEEWSAEWWKWIFAASTNRHPLFDPDGSWAHEGQPGGEVFFLAGTWGWPGTNRVSRLLSVPENKHLFFPLMNFWSDNVYADPPLTIDELRDMNAGYVSQVDSLQASIDGVPVPADLFAHRAISPVFSFDYGDNSDNLETFLVGLPVTGMNDPIVSDGYWLMIEPLPPGPHVLHFGGSTAPPWASTVDITARINVEPGPPTFVLPPHATVADKAIGDWIVESAKWEWSFSTNCNPFLDPDGRWAAQNQHEPVFFVAGYLVDWMGPHLARRYTVPAGKYLLFPLCMGLGDNVDVSPPFSEAELRDFLNGFFTPPPTLYFSIDGAAVTNLLAYREYVPAFSLDLPTADNIHSLLAGHAVTGLIDPEIWDGYWVMLAPLPVGRHVIQFEGNYQYPGAPHFERTDIIDVAANFSAPRRDVDGCVHLAFQGLLGQEYCFQASTNLVDWVPFRTNTVTDLPWEVVDDAAANLPCRFYRAVDQP